MINSLLQKYPLISDQVDKGELRLILEQLQKCLSRGIPGHIVEMGCYKGTTSLFIRRLLDMAQSDKEFHVYDSFEGLPEKSQKDASPAGTQFITGELSVSKKDFILEFKKAGLRTPIIHKGWFEQLTDESIPDTICFAFLDGDYYSSIQACLRRIENKLSPGAVVIVDDYQNEALPGARRAVDEWLHGMDVKLSVVTSLAIIDFSAK